MNEDKLTELFRNFQPELTSEAEFLSKLKGNLDAVELVKRHAAVRQKHNRTAVVVAALAGFVMGVILTLLLPVIGDMVATISIAIPDYESLDFEINRQVIGWIVMAVVSVITAINAYEITMSRLSKKITRIPINR